jgi:hypothetical protein
VESIFRVPWGRVGLDDVHAFLASAGDEGIRWEAKAGDPRRPDAKIEADLVRAAMCGLANSIGGYVIVGAIRDDETKEWSLPGVVFPGGEPKTWLDDVAESLRPRPQIGEPRVWGLDDCRAAAVVQVEPVAVPPCMTAGGQIFERTSGKTVRVTDPLVLARLTVRGEGARKAARSGAQDAFSSVSKGALRSDNRGVVVILGLRATGYEPDIASRLFRESTAVRLKEIVAAHLKQDRYTANTVASTRVEPHQDNLSVITAPGSFVTDPVGGDRVWQVVAIWNGAVGIRCEGNDPEIGIELLFDEIVVPAWRAAACIVPLIGGYGSAHLVLQVGATINTGREDWPTGNPHGGQIGRAPDTVEVDTALVESLKREVLRSMGHPAWEPEAAV